MKIAHITATFPPYEAGTGRVAYHNALGLAQRGHEVTVYTAGSGHAGMPDPQPPFRIEPLKPLLRLGNAPMLPGLLRLPRFDIIHLHLPFIFGAELIGLHTWYRRIPYVVTYHNDLIATGFKGTLFAAHTRCLLPLTLRRAARVIAVSRDHFRHSTVGHLADRLPLVELPNGVDTEHFHPAVRAAPLRAARGIPGDAPLVLFVGALDRAHHYRRVDILLHAVTRTNAHVLIVGDGDLLASHRRLAVTLGMAGRVHFLGGIANHELPRIYRCADVLVLPSSIQESFGLVLIEAMSCGIPVIASDLPGVRTVVAHEETGLLVRPSDPDDLADKLSRLLADQAARRRMGMQGRRKVEARYAREAIVAELEALYRAVLSQG